MKKKVLQEDIKMLEEAYHEAEKVLQDIPN